MLIDNLFKGVTVHYVDPKSRARGHVTVDNCIYWMTNLLRLLEHHKYEITKIEVPENHILRTWKDG